MLIGPDPGNPPVWVFVASITTDVAAECLLVARDLREWGIPTIVDGRPVRLKKKLGWADDAKAFFVLIVGPDDVAKGVVQVRDLDDKANFELPRAGCARHLAEVLLGPDDFRAAERRLTLKEMECT